jgi:transposase
VAQVAELFEYVIGVDTHAASHAYAVLTAATGAVVDQAQFPSHPAGLARAAEWMARRAPGPRLIAVECTGSYGATLARELEHRGERVCEIKPPKRQQRARTGKSDPFDAIAAARTALATDDAALMTPRAEGLRSALQVLLAARRAMDTRRTADRNTLNALIRIHGLGIDARKALTDAQIRTIAAWRTRADDDAAAATIRAEARRLAKAVLTATHDLTANRQALAEHSRELMPGLLEIPGVGPITAAIILTAWSHRGRVHPEAAFAALAGAAPLPASSGKTVRHRLSRAGDRQLNRALDVIARARMVSDPDTRAYVDRRTAEGRTHREIRRCLKRYIARQLYRQMLALSA